MSSTTENVVIKVCGLAGCPLVTKFICNGCQLTRYCSQDHQKADWRKHKKICSPLTLQISTELGRHYVATRNLKAGTLLLSEEPLLVEPLADCFREEFYKVKRLTEEEQDLHFAMDLGRQVVCLACCTPADGKKCPKCDWPICSIECSKAKIHADNECPVFVKNSLKMNIMDRETLVGVFLIRGLLIKKLQPELWDKIEDRQFESWSKTTPRDVEEEAFSLIVTRFQEKFKKLEKDLGEDFVNMEELVKLCGIQRHNAFAQYVDHEEKLGRTTTARILYLKSSLFSHACFPNCSWGVTCGPVFKMEIITAVNIAKGQVLSTAYSPIFTMMGAVKRNIDDMKIGNFHCHCARCVDPTELNTMMSAVKCTKGDCTDGYLIPKDPKNLSPTSIWACVICGDKRTETWEGINRLTKRAENMTKKFTDFEPKKIEDLLIILRKHLHPNHWVIQQFCRQVMRKLFDDIDLTSTNTEGEALDYFIKIARYIVQVSQITMPGLSYYKSEFQQMLFAGLRAKFHRIRKSSILDHDQMCELAGEMTEILDHILRVKDLEPTSRTNDGRLNPSMLEFMKYKLEVDIFVNL